MKKRHKFSANALELRLFCIKPSISQLVLDSVTDLPIYIRVALLALRAVLDDCSSTSEVTLKGMGKFNQNMITTKRNPCAKFVNFYWICFFEYS